MVARTLLPNRMNELPVRLLNVTDEPIKLGKHTVVSELEPLRPVEAREVQLDHQSVEDPIVNEMVDKIDSIVPDNIKEKLKQMLMKYSSVFSRDEWDLGWTDIVTHRIDTADNRPFRQPLRRYPHAHLEAIDKHLTDMLQQNVIEPASSPWASNIVLAKKKDGSLRCCIDYRKLNDMTRKDAYPLPRTDTCLDAMAECCWFNTFDLRSGFHQVFLHPDDADKTAFITRRGMFRFKTMPFGLCNAVATFQRLMDLVLSGLNFEICLVYLDDIILFSTTLEQHLERLELVLQRLKAANLKLKPSKCTLLQKEVIFLGHIVSSQGLATDPAKVKLIQEWPVPKNLRQLRGFLGLAGYYRKFVKDYSKIVGPLNDLMKKNRAFVWTENCQHAFDELKAALMSPPILALPRDDGMFILDTDAADHSIGAVLSQMQDGQEKVIAYAGRTLNKCEYNYCTTRKELLAVVYFTKLFRQYLLGKHFRIRTDHSAITWLRRTREPIGQNARWLELLEEYNFEVQHRRGLAHENADALSRHPCLNKPSCTACHPDPLQSDADVSADEVMNAAAAHVSFDSEHKASIDPAQGTTPIGDDVSTAAKQATENLCDNLDDNEGLTWTVDKIAAAQKDDSELSFITGLICSYQDKNAPKPPWKAVELQSAEVKALWHEWERLCFKNDVLFRVWKMHDGTEDRYQIIMPKIYRSQMISMVHTGMTGGHLGRSKTEEQLRRRAYWPSWRADVALELKQCTECVRYHRGRAPRQTPLQPFGAGEPFEIIAVDITGKHPKSARGNEYIVTVTDVFSKWSEAIPVRTHSAPVVAKILVDNVFSRYGMPRRLLTDQGAEFESQLFQELCRRMGIEKIRTTPYQPSTNGVVERFHRTLNSMLGKVVKLNQRDWDDHLQPVMAAYRAAKHESTGFSPNRLVFGRENRAPLDIVLGSIPGEESSYNSYDEYVCQLQEKLRRTHALAREHLNGAAIRRKDDYDIKVKGKTFKKGDWVWYFYPRKYVGRSPKWDKNYDGPFLVVDVIAPSDYVIQKSKKAKVQVVHCDKLKPCHGQTPISWLTDDQHDELSTSAPVQTAERKIQRQKKAAYFSDEEDLENVLARERLRSPASRRKPRRFCDSE